MDLRRRVKENLFLLCKAKGGKEQGVICTKPMTFFRGGKYGAQGDLGSLFCQSARIRRFGGIGSELDT